MQYYIKSLAAHNAVILGFFNWMYVNSSVDFDRYKSTENGQYLHITKIGVETYRRIYSYGGEWPSTHLF